MPTESARRDLIHFAIDAQHTCCALDELEREGWRVQALHRMDEVLRHLRDYPGQHFVGLLDLRGATLDAAIIERLAPMLAAPHLTWVAGVDPAQLDNANVRRVIRDYCHDYVQLPCPEGLLAVVLGHMHGMAELMPDFARDRPEAGKDSMVGDSQPMRAMQRMLRKAAMTEAPVLITGETGTGKELAALSIHRQSARHKQPFVAINCGAIPQGLMQSELFGYERGAFTGAMQRKQGRIEMAHRGTLFLDEIGDLPLDLQAALLRFLQERTVERLGGHDPIAVDVRIIAATHVDLSVAINKRRFRADLYHRLCVIQLQQPPLRARGEDILQIANYALQRYAAESVGKAKIKGFSTCAQQAMYRYDWPGNVRELINRVRQALVMAEGRFITAQDLCLDQAGGALTTLEDARCVAEREAIDRALLRNGHHLIATAAELGISRVTLYRLMNKHGMREPEHFAGQAMQAAGNGGVEYRSGA